MKIGIVCYPTYGGSGIIATELGIELACRGNEVHFISYAQPMRLDHFQDNVFFHAVELPHYPLFEFQLYSLALAGKIIDVVKYEDIDILHVHYAIPHAISGYLAKKVMENSNDFKLITTLHGTDISLVGLEPTFLPLVKFSLEQSDAITSVSGYLAEKTIQNFDIHKNIEIIPNFVDTDTYIRGDFPGIRNHIAPNGEKILVHISNFRPVKRVADTIRILDKVRQSVPAKLILVGDGPDRPECERLARELKLHEHVKFMGMQTSFVELLSVSDIFLLPSQSESFGLSALEAMSCSVPVVAYNIGGIPELINHDETGYVAELGDIDRMAKYVVDLLSKPKKWKIFSDNARKRAVEKFNKSQIVDKYVSVYNQF
jgi:L-malate glycosyltransferase